MNALDRFVRPIRLYVTPMNVCGHGDDCRTEWEAAAVDANDADVKAWVFDWIGHAIHTACKFAEIIGVAEVYISDGKTLTHKVDVQAWLHQDDDGWGRGIPLCWHEQRDIPPREKTIEAL